MGAFAAVSAVHFMIAGRNQVKPEDEEEAKRLAGGRDGDV
jgi:hypothetical protein